MHPIRFTTGSVRLMLRGGPVYFAWLAFLMILILVGAYAYVGQLQHGLITTNMRDQVSWAFYIGNFTFLVGVAAAAVVLVIPAYLYSWGPIKEIVILGELLAVAAIVMCLLFVTVDMGRPDRFWHLIPLLGKWNVPQSLLAWDVLVLNLYLILNLVIVTHLLYRTYIGKEYSKRFAMPLILLSIPAAVSIHTVTAFVYAGMAARPYWNTAILAPRFLASAFCSGPAIMLVLFQILRRTTSIKIQDAAIWKIAELMAYGMFINLFLFAAEIFREYYSATEHILFHQYAFHGLNGYDAIVPYVWASLLFSVTAFILFLVPKTRKNVVTLNLGALLIYAGVYIEKGIALVIPGFTPSTLGEIYEYFPSRTELMVSAGIYGVGFLLYTLMVKVAVPIMTGSFRADQPVGAGTAASPPAVEGAAAASSSHLAA
jgi:Ni/Fe-hydrogenase subunit HybB-like protein